MSRLGPRQDLGEELTLSDNEHDRSRRVVTDTRLARGGLPPGGSDRPAWSGPYSRLSQCCVEWISCVEDDGAAVSTVEEIVNPGCCLAAKGEGGRAMVMG